MPEIKILHRLLQRDADGRKSFAPKGAVINANDKVARSMVRRGVAILYNDAQRDADKKAEDAAAARAKLEVEEAKAKTAAETAAKAELEKRSRAEQRVPSPTTARALKEG